MKYVHSIAVLALIFAVVLGLPACKPPSGGQSGHEIEEFSENVELTKGQQEFLLKAARTALAGQPMPAFTADLENTIAGGVTVEVFLPPNRPVLAAVAKQPFSKAFAEAVELARTDSGFDRMKSKLDDARIKIGLMRRIRELKYRDDEKGERAFRDIAKQTEDAMDGFILAHNNGQVFYQLGEEVLYRGWGMGRRGERDRYMGRKLVKRQMRDLGREGEKNTNGWRNGKLYSFRTFTFVDDVARRGRPVESFRAKNLLPPLTKESLRAAAVANADYLARAVRDDGKFHYVYFPALNVYETRAYSIVRHAGSVYGLFEAYNHFGDEKYLTAGRKALDYLVDNIVIPEEASEIAIVKEGRRSNLGVNALTAMAYAVIPGDHMTEKEGEYRDKLGESILYYRMPEKGLFYTYFQQALQKNPPKEQARYYPGEAMLALVRLFERTGDKKWWDAAVDLAPGQKELWLNAGHNEVGNYCWVGQAFARMARLEKRSRGGQGV
ncbi:MAG: hypothetical protein M5R36_16600 [Deltaproteobacteria bacterium]|nr:hypothetical protein [Deltaproteobacteria bacterium]